MTELLLAVIGKSDNIAVLVLLLVCFGLGVLLVIWQKEARADRQKLYEVVEANTRAVEALRAVIRIV